jgi:hypothetical protein
MNARDRVQLLFGPYRAPRLRKGGRATCLLLDTDVVITGWTDARVSWPLCRPLDNRRGRPTILLDDELARAVRHEAAAAIRHWWGVSVAVVWRWRKALGVGRMDSEGSRRLIQAAVEAGADARGRSRFRCPPRTAGRRGGAGPASLACVPMSDVTPILSAIEQGDPHAAEQLLPLVYDELRRLALSDPGRSHGGQQNPHPK